MEKSEFHKDILLMKKALFKLVDQSEKDAKQINDLTEAVDFLMKAKEQGIIMEEFKYPGVSKPASIFSPIPPEERGTPE